MYYIAGVLSCKLRSRRNRLLDEKFQNRVKDYGVKQTSGTELLISLRTTNR
jgi:hypothetical protein